jgi:hypothetical protein
MAEPSPDQVAGHWSAAVGREYLAALRAQSRDGVPTLSVEACIGLGRA